MSDGNFDTCGAACPACGRVVQCERTHNGISEVGLAFCCGWSFEAWPEYPLNFEHLPQSGSVSPEHIRKDLS